MSRDVTTKRIIQGVAVAFSVLGLLWIFFGLDVAISSFGQSDPFATLLPASMPLALGGVALFVAWQNLRHFGPKSIRSITALALFSVYGILLNLLEPREGIPADRYTDAYCLAIWLLLILLACKSYGVVSRRLIQLTAVADSEEGDPTLLSNAASDASCEER
jgi:hypothetical protein